MCFQRDLVTGSAVRLESFTFETGSKLRKIGGMAFAGCSRLQSICFPASLSEIDGETFLYSCFMSIGFESQNQHFCVCGHFILDFDRVCIIRHFGANEKERIEIPEHIEVLGRHCFARREFDSVSFVRQSKLRFIRTQAFGMSNLRMICIPSSVRAIEDSAFFLCGCLSCVTFQPNSELTRVGACVFCDCHELKYLCLPCSVEFIGNSCFRRCMNLSTLSFAAPAHIRELLSVPTSNLSSVDIPDSVEVLETVIEVSRELTITFGDASKLGQLAFSGECSGRRPIRGFVRIPAHRLKVFRCNGEFVC
jgi:hypothetical protein